MSAPTQQELPSPGRQGAVGASFSGIGLRMLGTISERRKGETERARGDGSRWPRSLTSAGLAQERPGDEVRPLRRRPAPIPGPLSGARAPRRHGPSPPPAAGAGPSRVTVSWAPPRKATVWPHAQLRPAERTAGRGGVARFSLGSSEDPQRPPTVPRPRPASPRPAGPPSSCAAPTICAPRAAPRVLRPAGCSDQSSLEDRGRRAGPSLARFGTLGVFSCAFRRSSRAGRWSSVFLSGLSLSLSSSKTSCNCRFPGASEDLSSLILFRRCFLSHTL